MVLKYKAIGLAFLIGMVLGLLIRGLWLQESNAPDYKNIDGEEIKSDKQSHKKIINSNEIDGLKNKIFELTSELDVARKELSENSMTINFKKSDKTKPLTVSMLMEAGIDEFIAQEIIKRKDEREYKYLQLRDRAVRDGYIGTPKFRKELQQLKIDGASIKNELGVDAYDKYLYAMGQPNRVKVLSIMQGSPAEYTGIMIGDMIISYDGEKVFSWQELNKATQRGERDESVIINIRRDGGVFNILVPRGPIGVKLEAVRIFP